ncbi:MAG: alpha-amylase [Proteobacteria bacterium]|nr:alpha-amylase [Pseudomonadota bacterium]
MLLPLVLLSCSSEKKASETRNLHVASPDWREQVIYFAMIDRFNDGDTSNNDVGKYYDPQDARKYSGGDIKGLIEQLDYIKGLGATALWITPPVANQWWNPVQNFSGYHGYWARDHKQVDEHYGTLEDYKNLSHELHQRGMYLIQDIVPNHVGDFFYYDGDYNPADTAENFTVIANNVPVNAPVQEPFNLNDRRNPAHFDASIYHWTPSISDSNDQNQEFNYQLANLDDLNTENPVVIEALKDSFSYWITEVGVDGFRVDTVKYIDHPFWNEFFHGDNGIEAAARTVNRNDFLYFGEVFENGAPFDDSAEIEIASYEGTATKPELKSMIGFPLYTELSRVLTGGAAPAQLRYRLEKHMSSYKNPYIVPNFIDNHDVARFISGGSLASAKQALTTIFTVPGIPVVWQGTEQAHLDTRRAMFAGGIGTTTDQFITDSEMYTFISALARQRAAEPLLTQGDLTVLTAGSVIPGALAWRRSLADSHVFVLMNTSDQASLMIIEDTGLSGDRVIFETLMAENHEGEVSLDENGALVVELKARAILLIKPTDRSATATALRPAVTVATDLTGVMVDADTTLTGTVTPADAELTLVIDGQLGDSAIDIEPNASGAWTVALPSSIISLTQANHEYTIYSAQTRSFTAPVTFTTAGIVFDGTPLETSDPMGDDNGAAASYTYPMDDTFGRQQDILNMSASYKDHGLRLVFTMREHSKIWSPPNGYDHVSFHIFFDVPDAMLVGATVMPEQQSSTPAGFNWDYALRAYGWDNDVFGSAQATAEMFGEPIAAAPNVSSDAGMKTVTFEFDGSKLNLTSWEGVKIYATTWDIDGLEDELRPLNPAGAQWEFGGGAIDDPKIMDAIGPVTIPAAPAN